MGVGAAEDGADGEDDEETGDGTAGLAEGIASGEDRPAGGWDDSGVSDERCCDWEVLGPAIGLLRCGALPMRRRVATSDGSVPSSMSSDNSESTAAPDTEVDTAAWRRNKACMSTVRYRRG